MTDANPNQTAELEAARTMAETIRTVLNDLSVDDAPDRLRGALYSYEMAANREPPNARAAWVVTAGLVPGQPIAEFSKHWQMNSYEAQSPHSNDIFTSRAYQAVTYAESLQNPQRLNWVRLDWIWY